MARKGVERVREGVESVWNGVEGSGRVLRRTCMMLTGSGRVVMGLGMVFTV